MTAPAIQARGVTKVYGKGAVAYQALRGVVAAQHLPVGDDLDADPVVALEQLAQALVPAEVA